MIVREVSTLKSDPVKRDQENYIEGVAGLDDALAERIFSRPASGEKKVISIVWDPSIDELVIEISATAEA